MGFEPSTVGFVWIFIVLQTSVVANVSSKSFINVTFRNKCANDKPSQVFNIDSNQVNSICLPPSVQCSWSCSQQEPCISFNYKSGVDLCELYFYIPTNFTSTEGCSYFEVCKCLRYFVDVAV